MTAARACSDSYFTVLSLRQSNRDALLGPSPPLRPPFLIPNVHLRILARYLSIFSTGNGGLASDHGSTFSEVEAQGKLDVAPDRVQTRLRDLVSARVCTSVYVVMTGWRDGVLIIRIIGRRRGARARARICADKRARPYTACNLRVHTHIYACHSKQRGTHVSVHSEMFNRSCEFGRLETSFFSLFGI